MSIFSRLFRPRAFRKTADKAISAPLLVDATTLPSFTASTSAPPTATPRSAKRSSWRRSFYSATSAPPVPTSRADKRTSWRQSLYSATNISRRASIIPAQPRPQPIERRKSQYRHSMIQAMGGSGLSDAGAHAEWI